MKIRKTVPENEEYVYISYEVVLVAASTPSKFQFDRSMFD